MTEVDRLGEQLVAHAAEHETSLSKLTVLGRGSDPYRVGGYRGAHEDGRWFAEALLAALAAGGRQREAIHLRGIHYAAVELGLVKPDGEAYRNTDADWSWLQDRAAKCGRWLGYADWSQVIDARNRRPIIRLREEAADPYGHAAPRWVGLDPPTDPRPFCMTSGFVPRQAYHLVLFGEKTSLEPVLAPLADRYDADLFLPTGEATESMVFELAQLVDADERPTVVLYLADCDPSGWQMPISVARKLQALRDLEFPDLTVELRRVALTPDQVREFHLPHAPMKPTELRADRWLAAHGVQQTEIDAIATIRPALLERIVYEAVEPFYDRQLDLRVGAAERAWQTEAQAALEAQLPADEVESLTGELADLRRRADDINERLAALADGLMLPPLPKLPDPQVAGSDGESLFDTSRNWVTQTRQLKAEKAYE